MGNLKSENELNNKKDEQVLETSSTGYGFESVSVEHGEEHHKRKQKTNLPTCGGL